MDTNETKYNYFSYAFAVIHGSLYSLSSFLFPLSSLLALNLTRNERRTL